MDQRKDATREAGLRVWSKADSAAAATHVWRDAHDPATRCAVCNVPWRSTRRQPRPCKGPAR